MSKTTRGAGSFSATGKYRCHHRNVVVDSQLECCCGYKGFKRDKQGGNRVTFDSSEFNDGDDRVKCLCVRIRVRANKTYNGASHPGYSWENCHDHNPKDPWMELNLVGSLTFNYTLISNISTAYNSGHILTLFFLGQQTVYQKRTRIPLGKDCY